MDLTLLELNEIIYALGVADTTGMMVNKPALQSASEKVMQELKRKCEELDRQLEEAAVLKAKAEPKVEKVVIKEESKVEEPEVVSIPVINEDPIEFVPELPVELEEKPKSIAPKKSKLIDPEK